jgi:hypothetical protein
VRVATKLNRSHVLTGREARRLAPASRKLRSEVAIITGLGAELFGDDLGWSAMGADYSVIRGHAACRRPTGA